jgi:hypothetical protein
LVRFAQESTSLVVLGRWPLQPERAADTWHFPGVRASLLFMSARLRCRAVIVLLCPVILFSGVQVRLRAVKPEVVREGIQGYWGNDARREATLKGFFESAGCTSQQLSEQPVKHLKQPNRICVLPGDTNSVILVGAHYDHVDFCCLCRRRNRNSLARSITSRTWLLRS